MFKQFTVLLCAASVASGFVAGPIVRNSPSSSSSLQMIDGESVKKAAASLVAATFVLGSVAVAPPAFAASDVDNASLFGSSTEILAGRSGGRAGGRMGGGMRSSSMRSRPSSPTVINRNTYVTQPRVVSPGVTVVAPSPFGYGYNPYGGLGLGLGLNAVNSIGNEMRDYRQEGEIRDTRMELERSKMREGELEARLRALEQQQGGQLTPQQLQVLQQIQQAQPVPAPAAPAAK